MKLPSVSSVTIILLATIVIFQQSCKKKDSPAEPDYLTVDLPNSTLQNDLFNAVDDDVRSADHAMPPRTVSGERSSLSIKSQAW